MISHGLMKAGKLFSVSKFSWSLSGSIYRKRLLQSFYSSNLKYVMYNTRIFGHSTKNRIISDDLDSWSTLYICIYVHFLLLEVCDIYRPFL